MSQVSELGASMPRLEASAKATGVARYTADLAFPNMLHGAVLMSTSAHARIKSYDVSAARALPGVRAVMTGADIPRKRFGLMIADETALAIDKVRYIGEPVAAVAAIDRETALAAAELIQVEYEDLPGVFTPDEAMMPDAAIVHETFAAYPKNFDCIADGNAISIAQVLSGDPDEAWAEADVVVEGVYETQAQYHAYMEPVAAVADVDGLGRVTVWSSTQSVFRTQICIAEALDLPRAKVRSISPYVGGGFGGKSEPGVQIIAALLARETGRAVKVVLSRQEDMMMMRSRHPARIHLKTGARRDGTILVRTGSVVMDGGAYADDSPAAMHMVLHFLRGPYRVPHLRFDGRVLYTNKLRAAAFRGVGNAQATFACESQIDELARKLSLDPIDLRLRNVLQQGDSWLGKHPIGSASIGECLQRVRSESNWDARRAALAEAPTSKSGKRRGLGVSSVVYTCAYLSTSAIVRLLDDGTVTIATGAVDIGQGSDTAIAQMCAAALRLPVDSVNIVQADTDATPFNSGTNASRITYMLGQVIAQATDDIVSQLFPHAAELLECSVEDVELVPGGRVAIKGVKERFVSFADCSRRAHFKAGGPIIGRGSYVFRVEEPDTELTINKGMMSLAAIGTYVFGAQVVETEVDEVTGKVEVVEAWSAHDVGRAVNRQAVEGQIEGGLVQGIGFALMEELVWSDGQLTNPSFMDYKIPCSLDAPENIHAIVIENPEPTHPFGVKGIGEPPVIGIAPAVGNAVEHAVNVRVRQLPITSERVLRCLLDRGS
ncbi:xanthine dehydrogenase family protein molybdopterin-binding subunit [Mesorhizobium sp. YM1C-6-2]|uniref:xanthine dehydrogenase family protein molybdopterin-binding subunit n=1 Tax=Mesorhizobium sp. YM1C-6-2 TaxID=1827501 RepID=UPI001AED091D|nr:xanthine dehydrogenase family protein molybdopterin-binding subunit [Mesorhizobium sp. YM1C-6-2]